MQSGSLPKEEVKPAEGINLPPERREHYKDRKSLAIALVVSVVFLLAAIGVATWLFVQKVGSNTVITQIDPNSVANVKEVSWVAPDMPDGYIKYDQSTSDAGKTYYANSAEGCSVNTYVLSVKADADLQKLAAEAGNTTGIKAINIVQAASTAVADADGQRQYDFDAAKFTQEVSVPVTDVKANTGLVFYKQFGNHLAATSFVCKAATYDASEPDLTALLKEFKVETVR